MTVVQAAQIQTVQMINNHNNAIGLVKQQSFQNNYDTHKNQHQLLNRTQTS